MPISDGRHDVTAKISSMVLALLLALFAVPALGELRSAPVVTFNPTSLDFGNQSVGDSTTLPVTVTNNGNAVLNFSGIKMAGGNRKDFSQTNTCGGTLKVNG